jgi:chaperonin GroEL (HSP60 family)
LEKAEELIDKNVHPSVIVDGYTAASIEALQTLDKIAIKVKTDDRDLLAKIANTSMYSKLVSEDSPVLSKIVVDATQMIAELNEKTKTLKVDLYNIKV